MHMYVHELLFITPKGVKNRPPQEQVGRARMHAKQLIQMLCQFKETMWTPEPNLEEELRERLLEWKSRISKPFEPSALT